MQKKISLIILLFFISIVNGQDCNIGNQDSSGFDNAGDPIFENFLLGVKFSLNENGILKSLNLIGRNTGAQVKMVVYNDLNGVPNDLIAESGIGVVGDGILSLMVQDTNLIPGDYWIMAIYDEDGGHTFNTNSNPGNVVYFTALTFGDPIPTNAGGFENYTDTDLSYFMEVTCGTLDLIDIGYENKIHLWPNPSKQIINISSKTLINELKIFDLMGREIRHYKPRTSEFNLVIADLAIGSYFIVYNTPLGNIHDKFVKE